MRQRNERLRAHSIITLALALLAGCAPSGAGSGAGPTPATGVDALIPAAADVQLSSGAPFTITENTAIRVPAGSAEVAAIAEQLAAILRPSTGYPLPVTATRECSST